MPGRDPRRNGYSVFETESSSPFPRATARAYDECKEEKMRTMTVLLTAFTLAAAGCGGGGRSAEPATGNGTTTTTAQALFDRAFIDAMVPHHQSAIEMARAAKQAGLAQPELITIADDIIVSQQKEIDRMRSWRKQWFGSSKGEPEEAALKALGLSPAEAGMEHGAMDLSAAADIDQAFAEMMIAHHQGAIRMARLAEEKARHAALKNLAGDIIAAQEREIGVMEKHAKGEHH
jgi:uncharacterized protein (DUF305 family)